MKTLLVEFKLDDTWEAYIPDDEEKLRNLRHDINQDGVETRIIKDQELKDKQFTEMHEALKEVYKDLTNKVRFQDGLTLDESKYNAVIGKILKELES